MGERIEQAVAVSTPFHGSSLAAFVPLPSVRALRPDDAVMRELAAGGAANDRIVSVWGWFDPNIPGGCELEGAARNIRLPVGGHFRILGSPTLLALVDDLVR